MAVRTCAELKRLAGSQAGQQLSAVNFIEMKKVLCSSLSVCMMCLCCVQNLKAAHKEYKRALLLLQDFWSQLQQDVVDLNKCERIMLDLVGAQRNAQYSFTMLLEKVPIVCSPPSVVFMYSLFWLAVSKRAPHSERLWFVVSCFSSFLSLLPICLYHVT